MYTATQASQAIALGDLTAEQLAEACINRFHERGDVVRAWTCVEPDQVLSQARMLDMEKNRGPLHGIPVGIKDVFLTEDFPTSYNSPHFQNYHPRVDAAAVAILRAAGAVIFGKNDTVEFAVNGRRARTRNPHDLSRTPGGSSSGSAAAVADFQVPLSLGTQTGGSVIRPASYCGVYAMKPTWNAVPHEGFKVCSASMDTVGWFARSAQDLELLCDVFGLHDEEQSPEGGLDNRSFALCHSPVWEQALPETHAAIERCVAVLRAAGASVEMLELGEPFDRLTAAHKTIMQSEMRSAFMAERKMIGNGLYGELYEIISDDRRVSRSELTTALDLAAECRALFDRRAGGYDAVLTPSTAGVAPVGLENTGAAIFNRIWTLLHVPCVNVPGLTGPENLPVGVSLIGPRFTDRNVLAMARQLGALLTTTEKEADPGN